jgi:hypothetical protein
MYDSGGNLTLYWASGSDTSALDEADYDEDWHNALLSSGEREGVALGAPACEGLFQQTRQTGLSASANTTGSHGTPAAFPQTHSKPPDNPETGEYDPAITFCYLTRRRRAR